MSDVEVTSDGEVAEKRCYVCKTVKPASAFYRSVTRMDGLQSCCKVCDIATSRDRVRLSRQRARDRRRQETRRQADGIPTQGK